MPKDNSKLQKLKIVNPKYEVVYIRLTKAQKIKLRELAKDSMMSMTAFIRHAISALCDSEISLRISDANSKHK